MQDLNEQLRIAGIDELTPVDTMLRMQQDHAFITLEEDSDVTLLGVAGECGTGTGGADEAQEPYLRSGFHITTEP